MPAYSFRRKSVNYVTSEGIRHSRIVIMLKMHDRLYYQLENGDFIEDTPFGFVKTYENEGLLKDIRKMYCGTTR